MQLLLPTILGLLILSQLTHAADKPNIIVIYTDDHGWPDIDAAGINNDIRTPHLDRLAAVGVYASNGYSTAPQCVPSRAGLLIGKYQNRFGVESNGMDLAGFNRELTIAERLKHAGYATGQIGKWHLGPASEITRHGFDDVYAKNGNRPCHANFTLAGRTIPMQLVNDKLYHLDACSQAARAFIVRHQEKPFFLYLAYRAPHVPLDAPEKYLSRFPGKMAERRRQALAMISAMDDGVGLIRSTLKRHDLEQNTIIFYIGDNGAPLKIHKHDAPGGGPGWDGSLNEPMNGEKGMLSEGGIRVPFVIAWPGSIPGGQVYGHPIIALDVAATAVALAGLRPDDSLDGVNLVPYFRGERQGAPHTSIQWRWIAQSAIRAGDWKLLKGGKREYLFNLSNDRGEKTNLIHSEPAIAERLRAKLAHWADGLQPRGLALDSRSDAWKRYFDFYLDGKPAPPQLEKARPNRKADAAAGWLIRNGSLSANAGALLAKSKGNKPPFLVQSKLKLNGRCVAKIRFRAEKAGRVGIAWRLQGQEDFAKDQIASAQVNARPEWQDVEIPIAAQGTIIHIRLHIPAGSTAIDEVRFIDANDRDLKSWDFEQ